MTLEFNKQLMDMSIQINRMEVVSLESEANDIPKDPNKVLAEMRDIETFAKKALDISEQLYNWYRLPLESFFLKRVAKLAYQNADNAIRTQKRMKILLDVMMGEDIFVQQEWDAAKDRLRKLQSEYSLVVFRAKGAMRPYDAVSRVITILLRTEIAEGQSLRRALLENLEPYVIRSEEGDAYFHYVLVNLKNRIEATSQLGTIPTFWFDKIIEQYPLREFGPVKEMDDSLITKETTH